MTVAWPASFPIPKRSGHSYQAADLVLRSELDGAVPKAREMLSDGPTVYNISFVLRTAQRAKFERYFAVQLNMGAGEFYLPVDTSSGVVQKRARFISPPSYDTSAGNGFVSVDSSVEILDNISIVQEFALLLEDGFFLLLEDGGHLVLEP